MTSACVVTPATVSPNACEHLHEYGWESIRGPLSIPSPIRVDNGVAVDGGHVGWLPPTTMLCVTALTNALALDEIALAQAGVVSWAQLRAAGVDRWHVRDHVHARRWRVIGSRVVVLHRGDLTPEQRRWVAVLHCGRSAALARRSALEAAGLQGWPATEVHVVVAKGTRVARLSGVVVHESRGLTESDIDWRKSPSRMRVERAAIDEASASREPRTACALLAAVVQHA